MHPVLFQIGSVKIYSYGFMMALGIWIAILVARKLSPQVGIEPDKFTDMALFAVLGGLIGAYINYIISYDWSRFKADPFSVLKFWEMGLVFLGGLIGGVIFAVIYIRRRRWSFWEVADIFAVSVPLAYGFGRIGCFLAGCCYGIPCQLPWAVTFPSFSTPRHPTQLYSMLLGFSLAAFAWFFRKKRRFAGQSFLLYLFLYGLGRGFIEFLRDEPKVFGTSLSVAQFTGLVLIVIAGILYPILAKKNRYKPDSGDNIE